MLQSGPEPVANATFWPMEGYLVLTATLSAFLISAMIASPPPEQRSDTTQAAARDGHGFTEWDRATGEWWGARTSLEGQGLTFSAANIFEWTGVWSGGLENRAQSRNLFTFDAALDLEAMAGFDGATLFAQYMSVTPDMGGSDFAGDIQGFSNIENPSHIDALYEIWWEQRLFEERLRFKIGKFDANSEFDVINIAGDFANSSAGFSPTIIGFPSYPASAFGIGAFLEPVDNVTLSYAFMDGAFGVDGVPTGSRGPSTFLSDDKSDDYFHIVETGLKWESLGVLKEGRLAFGGSLHTGEFERFEGGTEEGGVSFYATLSQRLTSGDAAPGAPDDAGLYAFAQYGWADEEISDFAQHAAAGLVLAGPFSGRPLDRAGVYFTWVDLSDVPEAGFERNELAIDSYYRAHLTRFAWVQPEIQVIVSPSGDPDIDPAVVGGLRIGFDF